MAYASAFLTALKDKPLSGLFVNDYFLQDKCLNAMQFNNGATVNSAGGMSYTVVRTEKVTGAAASRAFGSDYTVVNSNPVPETFYLAVLGGKYQVDSTQDEILKKVLSENEAREKMSAAVNEFARQLIKGDPDTNAGEFLGFEKYCTENDLVMTVKGVLPEAGITEDIALAFLGWFNKLKGKLTVDANAIYCSRDMASALETVQAILGRHTTPITIGKVNYETFLGLPIIPLDNSIGLHSIDVDEEEEYEDIYLARLDVNNGVFCGSPADKAAFVKVVKPVETGSPIATGYVDFATCFVPKNKGAIIGGTVQVK